MKLHHLLSRDLPFTLEGLATLTQLHSEGKYEKFNETIFAQERKHGEWNLVLRELKEVLGQMRGDLEIIFCAQNELPGKTGAALAEVQNLISSPHEEKINEDEFINEPGWKKFHGQLTRGAALMRHCREIIAAHNRGARLAIYTDRNNPAEGNFVFFKNHQEISEQIIHSCKLCLDLKISHSR